MADVGDHLRVGAASGDQGGRIGRQIMEQQEGDDRDAEQHADRLQEPLGEQRRHQPRPRWVGSSRSRKRVADEIEGERGRQDDRARDEHEPGRRLKVALAFVDDVSPGRLRRLNADAEEGQGRLEQHGRRDAERPPDDRGRQEMRARYGARGCAHVPPRASVRQE